MDFDNSPDKLEIPMPPRRHLGSAELGRDDGRLLQPLPKESTLLSRKSRCWFLLVEIKSDRFEFERYLPVATVALIPTSAKANWFETFSHFFPSTST